MKKEMVRTQTHTTFIFDQEGFNHTFKYYGLEAVIWDFLSDIIRYGEYHTISDRFAQLAQMGTLKVQGVINEPKDGIRPGAELVMISFKMTEHVAKQELGRAISECVEGLIQAANDDAQIYLGEL